MNAAVPGREQRRMPTEQPFLSQRIGKMLRGIQHHFHHAFNIAISGDCARDVDAQPPRNRRAHLIGIQNLALNLAGLQHVQRQRRQHSFVLADETQPFHAANQPPLTMPDMGKHRPKFLVIPRKSGPVATLVDVSYSPHNLRR